MNPGAPFDALNFNSESAGRLIMTSFCAQYLSLFSVRNFTLNTPVLRNVCVGDSLMDVLSSPNSHLETAKLVDALLNLNVKGSSSDTCSKEKSAVGFGSSSLGGSMTSSSLHPQRIRAISAQPIKIFVFISLFACFVV